jgi:hypothetical protein
MYLRKAALTCRGDGHEPGLEVLRELPVAAEIEKGHPARSNGAVLRASNRARFDDALPGRGDLFAGETVAAGPLQFFEEGLLGAGRVLRSHHGRNGFQLDSGWPLPIDRLDPAL